MTTITAADALDLAKLFKASAHAIGQFELDHWNELAASDRLALSDVEWTLLDHGQNLITYAVGVVLDDLQVSLEQIKKATADANQAIQQVTDLKNALNIASALVTLGAAIVTGHPGAIVSAVEDVVDAVKAAA